MRFLEIALCFDSNTKNTKSIIWGTLDNKIMTGSSNGLKLNGRRVIAWTNHDQGLWHHMVSLGHNGK